MHKKAMIFFTNMKCDDNQNSKMSKTLHQVLIMVLLNDMKTSAHRVHVIVRLCFSTGGYSLWGIFVGRICHSSTP